jgi:hypothetical protein
LQCWPSHLQSLPTISTALFCTNLLAGFSLAAAPPYCHLPLPFVPIYQLVSPSAEWHNDVVTISIYLLSSLLGTWAAQKMFELTYKTTNTNKKTTDSKPTRRFRRCTVNCRIRLGDDNGFPVSKPLES